MRCTDRKLTPTAFADRRPVQCSLLAAAGPSARSITRCTVTAGNGGCLVAGQAGLRRVAIANNRVKLTAIGVTFTTIPALMTRA
jgi:hypothetical protein